MDYDVREKFEDLFTAMDKYFDDKWESGLKRLYQRKKRAIKDGMHEVLVFTQARLAPEILDFLQRNMHIIVEVVIRVAEEYADNPNVSGEFKRQIAIDRSADLITEVDFDNQWVNLLIELVVTILKTQGVIGAKK